MLELTGITVARIDENPALVPTGLDSIERWTRQYGGYLPQAYAEWKQLIGRRAWPDLRAILLQDNDEGQRLRSSSPFLGIINEEESAAILKRSQSPPIPNGSAG